MENKKWKAKAYIINLSGKEVCLFKSKSLEGLQKSINDFYIDQVKKVGADEASKLVSKFKIKLYD